MKIEFSPHAESQIIERALKIKDIKKVLEYPDEVVNIIPERRKIAQKIIKYEGKRFLYRVIYKHINGSYLVITAYRTSKIKKYFGGR